MKITTLLLFIACSIYGQAGTGKIFYSENSGCSENVESSSRFRESGILEYHKYYISVSNVKYNKEASSLQMVSRFFIDDMEDVLNARNPVAVELGVAADIKNHYESIQKYLNAKLYIRIKGSNLRPKLIGAEYVNDQIVLYTEFKTASSPTEIKMSFDAFCEMFEEQQNLVHFNINDERKTLVLDRSTPLESVKF
jgi:hypothetical protein